ncbi:MAG: ribosome maturation factor RimM [Candidatus Binatia bacterium]
MSRRLVPLGEIVATHGIEGWLKLKPYNPQTTALSSSGQIFLEKKGICSSYALQRTTAHKGQFLLKLQGINGMDEAKNCVGAILSIAEEALQPLAPGQYYYYQAVGLDVFDIQGRHIGTVTQIWPKEGGDLYVVRGSDKEYLIPAAKEVIERIDLAAGQMIINPPPGLLDL